MDALNTKWVEERWSEQKFFQKRRDALARWPTGGEIEDIREGIEYCRKLPKSKNMATALTKAKQEGKILLQSFMGYETVDKQIAGFEVAEESGADLQCIMGDTYTRKNQFELVEASLEKKMQLNGLPIVNIGLKELRRVTEATELPVEYGAFSPDPALQFEMALAAGVSFFPTSNCLVGYLMHDKDQPMEEAIYNWQYVAKLWGYYTEAGWPVVPITMGYLTGAMVPPSLGAAFTSLSCLELAQLGIKYVSVSGPLNGNLIQDVAACKAVTKLSEEYLHKFGYNDVCVFPKISHFMGAFPDDFYHALALIAWCAAVGALAGVNYQVVKTPLEAKGITNLEGHRAGLKVSRQIVNMLRSQKLPSNEPLQTEIDMIMLEARAIVDRTIELGDGEIGAGVIAAVKAGVLDEPFTPYQPFARKVMTMKDSAGAVRWLAYGNVPLPMEAIEYNREKLTERQKIEGMTPDFELISRDLLGLARATE